MAELERTYIIPLRRGVMLAPMYKRAKKAVNTLRSFLEKHMKSDDVRLGAQLNLALWERGIKNPPLKVKVTAKKDDKGVVRAELFGHTYVEKKKIEKKEKSKLEQLKEKVGLKTEEKKEEDKNKEAITHIHEEKKHDHTAKENLVNKEASAEEQRKASINKQKAEYKDKK